LLANPGQGCDCSLNGGLGYFVVGSSNFFTVIGSSFPCAASTPWLPSAAIPAAPMQTVALLSLNRRHGAFQIFDFATLGFMIHPLDYPLKDIGTDAFFNFL
jgi:hypothetical protein